MNKYLKVFVGGAALSLAVFLSGRAISFHMSGELDNLKDQCVAEATKEELLAKQSGKPRISMVCDPDVLEKLDNLKPGNLKEGGIQELLVKKLRQRRELNDSILFISLCIFAASVLPFLWHFLLARIKELRVAAFLRNNWLRILCVAWLCWATYMLIQIKDETDSCASWRQVSDLESDVSSIESDVSSIESDVSSIESDVSAIKKEVSSKYDYDTLRSAVEKLKNR